MRICSRPVWVIVLATMLCTASSAFAQKRVYKFGSDKAEMYSRERGFGFEPNSQVICWPGTAKGNGNCNSTSAFYFSAVVPEGNYRVTVRFGDPKVATSNVVKAELRRLMLERVDTKLGEFVTRSFIVNVRTPFISTGGEVKLKDREKTSEQWAWDEKLTLEFNGTKASINRIEIEPVNVPTVFLLGDSTVCDQPGEPYASWGQMITRFFDGKVAVANHAESGESLRSSFGAKRLDKVVSQIKRGDFLLIQYGHNDMKEKGEGIGAFTSYKASLKQFTAAARAKGATVILINPMHRRTFDTTGKFITNSHGDYPEAVRQAASEEKVAFIDLHAKSKLLYEAFGKDGSGVLFKEGDGTHHNAFGAYQLAKIIVQSIRDQRLPLAKYLVKDWKTFDPNRPDSATAFSIPASPAVAHQKPLGN
ncbi:MAG: rhamnogalacturonan acetylesterase [Pyrinomonadaceae bacterium]